MTTTINNEHKKLNAPNLRFPEFQGEWEECKLSNVCTFFSGGTPSSSNKDYYGGKIPFIRSGELHKEETELFITQSGYENSSAKMVEVGDLLLAMYGATSGEIAISKINGAINQAILCIRTKHNKKFVESVWNKHVSKILMKYLQGGQGNLSADIVKRISFSFPSLAEQEKLSQLMQLIDNRIATQSKVIEDLKSQQKFWIDRIFCLSKSSGRNYILLSKIAKKVTRRNKDNEVGTVLSNTANQGIIAQDNIFGREIANEENTNNYYVIEKGNFVYNPRKSANAPYGPVNKYDGNEKGIISPLYLCFSVSNINADYLQWYFKSNAWYKYVYQKGDSGVRHDRVSIKDDVFLAMPLYVHTDKEQTEIVEFLNLLQKKIDIEEGLKELYANQKVYLLRQMFI